jgi:hypothetical protein
MSAGDIGSLANLANSLTVPLVLVIVIAALAKGVVVTKGHHEAVVKEKEAQIAALTQLYAERTSVSEKRADVLHQEKEQLLRQLDANSQSLFRFTDVIGELRDAVRDLTRVRRA